MRNVWTIAKREYRLYLATPIAYIMAGVILFVLGVLFAIMLTFAMQPMAQFVPSVDLFIGWLYFPLLFFTLPAITMRLLSDELRQGTIELLMTAPVRDWEVVVGKWLGAMLFVISVLALTWIYPFLLNQIVTPGIDQGVLMSGYLGLVLVASASVAVGVAISSLFNNLVATFISTLGAYFVIWFLLGFSFSSQMSVSTFGEVMRYLDFASHFQDTMARGAIDLADIIYFASMTVLALVVGSISLETRRWR
jgi:ABC-2 type transport system permease protein